MYFLIRLSICFAIYFPFKTKEKKVELINYFSYFYLIVLQQLIPQFLIFKKKSIDRYKIHSKIIKFTQFCQEEQANMLRWSF